MGQLAMIRQPARKSLHCHDAPLYGAGRFLLRVHFGKDLVHPIRVDVANRPESGPRANFEHEFFGSHNMVLAPLPGSHHRLEVCEMLFNRPGSFRDQTFLALVDETVAPQRDVVQLLRQDALRRLLVGGKRVVLAALAVGIVPGDAVRTVVAPFEDTT